MKQKESEKRGIKEGEETPIFKEKDTEKRGRKKGRETQIKEELFEKFGGIC